MTLRSENILTLRQGVEFLSPRDLLGLRPPTKGKPFEEQTHNLYQQDCLPWEPTSKRIFAEEHSRRWKHLLYVGVLARKEIHASMEGRGGPPTDYAGLREGKSEQTALFAVVADNHGQIDASTLELAEFPWLLGRLKPHRFSVPTVAEWEKFKAQAKGKLSSILTEQAVVTTQHLTQAAAAYVKLAG